MRATSVFAYACAAIGGLIGGWFALRLGPLFALLMAVGAAAVLFYSEVFARVGVGELAAGLGLGALPVWGAAWVQGPPPGPAALWAGVPAFFMTFDLLLLNEFPDEEADRAGGRKNLVLMLGRKGAALVYAGAAALTPLVIVAAVALRVFPLVALAAVVPSLLLRKPLAWALGDTREPVPVAALAANVTWNLATNASSRSRSLSKRDPDSGPAELDAVGVARRVRGGPRHGIAVGIRPHVDPHALGQRLAHHRVRDPELELERKAPALESLDRHGRALRDAGLAHGQEDHAARTDAGAHGRPPPRSSRRRPPDRRAFAGRGLRARSWRLRGGGRRRYALRADPRPRALRACSRPAPRRAARAPAG